MTSPPNISIGPFVRFTVVWLLVMDLLLLPTIVAAVRRHRHLAHVFTLNVTIGWTIVGWIYALFMASTQAQTAAEEAEADERVTARQISKIWGSDN